MTSNTKPISVDYSDERLRTLVEEFITMQKKEFTFKGVCSYILYRAMEEERPSSLGLCLTRRRKTLVNFIKEIKASEMVGPKYNYGRRPINAIINQSLQYYV